MCFVNDAMSLRRERPATQSLHLLETSTPRAAGPRPSKGKRSIQNSYHIPDALLKCGWVGGWVGGSYARVWPRDHSSGEASSWMGSKQGELQLHLPGKWCQRSPTRRENKKVVSTPTPSGRGPPLGPGAPKAAPGVLRPLFRCSVAVEDLCRRLSGGWN